MQQQKRLVPSSNGIRHPSSKRVIAGSNPAGTAIINEDSMTERSINISPKELEVLTAWIETFDPNPHVIHITATATGIGTALRAEVETAEGEGRFKDLTDYESW